ncbi:hypothetical protein JYT44_02215 [Caldithrix abyssi]|nr:hypothetical protein [Caldithrix abyssi]
MIRINFPHPKQAAQALDERMNWLAETINKTIPLVDLDTAIELLKWFPFGAELASDEIQAKLEELNKILAEVCGPGNAFIYVDLEWSTVSVVLEFNEDALTYGLDEDLVKRKFRSAPSTTKMVLGVIIFILQWIKEQSWSKHLSANTLKGVVDMFLGLLITSKNFNCDVYSTKPVKLRSEETGMFLSVKKGKIGKTKYLTMKSKDFTNEHLVFEANDDILKGKSTQSSFRVLGTADNYESSFPYFYLHRTPGLYPNYAGLSTQQHSTTFRVSRNKDASEVVLYIPGQRFSSYYLVPWNNKEGADVYLHQEPKERNRYQWEFVEV